MTHYHADHVGRLESLLAKLPVGTFLDYGSNRELPPPNATPRQLTVTNGGHHFSNTYRARAAQ